MSFPRKRSGSNSKKSKEKYEILFKTAEDSEELSENLGTLTNTLASASLENFELDLSKANFENAVIKKNFNLLLKYCIDNIETKDDGKINL